MKTRLTAQGALTTAVAATIVATTGCYSIMASAQSSIILYGTVDTSVRYVTHADSAGDSKVGLANGGLSESVFGLKGSEDLGGGASAVFQLEDRFFPNSGTIDPAYPFFNTAFVGLQSTTYGRLTLGRQINPLTDAVLRTYVSNAWLPTNYEFRPEATMSEGVWTSNMAKYVAQWQDVTVELSYAFGGAAGNFGAGSQIGASVAYAPQGPLRLGAAYLDARDAVNSSLHVKAWTAGGAYTFGNTRINAGWIENRQDPGFGNFPNGPYTPTLLAALKYSAFASRDMFFGGITQTLTPALHLSGNVWRTIQRGENAAKNGNATQFSAIADYNLSKHTDVYIEADYSLYRGGLVGAQLQGISGVSSADGTTQLGMMVGLRHLF
ncbi:porin [Paraburkholderia sediminicola]|uniref:porin n=1 Tax=Paraburkholderia sediminicola TaxID=458836 RepID=UPI0038B81261